MKSSTGVLLDFSVDVLALTGGHLLLQLAKLVLQELEGCAIWGMPVIEASAHHV